jgi:apolipoprotein D and lipocalin family protein
MPIRTAIAVGALAALAIGAAPAHATPEPAKAHPPQPARSVPPSLYAGRWYEIARTPNQMQSDCQGSTSDFSGWSAGDFHLVQTCHAGSPLGPGQTFDAHGRVLPASANAKMRLGFLGGLISQEYWILDHADDEAWAIMDRADGRYVWLLSRRPTLSPADRATALARLQALGFDLSHLAYPQQLQAAR